MEFRAVAMALILSVAAAPPAMAYDELEQEIGAFVAANNLPGVVTLIQQGEDTLHFSAVGRVNTRSGPGMQKDAIFRIFSMSKPVVAFALLQLVDQGKLELDDDIRRYLPALDPFEFDGQEYTVTVRHLLSHTAGLGYGGGFRSWTQFRYLIANPLSKRNKLDDLIDDISGIDLLYVPGQRWGYSLASDVQGALVEAASGLTLDEYLRQNVFDPLQMHDTAFQVPQEKAARLVDLYEYDAEGLEELTAFDPDDIDHKEPAKRSAYLRKPVLLSGGGGLVSTAADYSRFVRMLLNKGRVEDRQLLSSELVEQMLTSHTRGLDTSFLPAVYPNTGFGYGLGVKEAEGGYRTKGSFYWAGMGGTVFWGDPENDLLVVAMMQVEDGWVALERWLVPRVYSLIE